MLNTSVQGALMRPTGINGSGNQQSTEHGNQIQIFLAEQISSVVGNVIVGEATASLVGPGQHGGGEITLRLDVKQGPEIQQIQQIRYGRRVVVVVVIVIVFGAVGHMIRLVVWGGGS